MLGYFHRLVWYLGSLAELFYPDDCVTVGIHLVYIAYEFYPCDDDHKAGLNIKH